MEKPTGFFARSASWRELPQQAESVTLRHSNTRSFRDSEARAQPCVLRRPFRRLDKVRLVGQFADQKHTLRYGGLQQRFENKRGRIKWHL